MKKSFPEDKQWLAFAKWYLEASGFDITGHENQLVDGARDGGIDVIATPNNGDIRVTYVIQSKYVTTSPTPASLRRFMQAVRALSSESSTEFDEWLDSVHDRHRRLYKSLRSKRKTLRFVLITTARVPKDDRRSLEKGGIEVCDKREIEDLFTSYLQGQTPRAGVLKIRAKSRTLIGETKEHRLWCASVPLSDLSKAYEKWGDDLFAGNVRHALRNQNATKVKQGIRDTLKERPEEFIYFHNGITVVSKPTQYRKGVLTLVNPSIVNGAQTVSTLGRLSSSKISSRASVLMKLIEIHGDTPFEKLETDIAIASNTQNKVDFSDLTVAEPALVDLEKGFRRHALFLERKRGSWPSSRPYLKISKERLVQLMAAVKSEAGSTRAKNPQDLFKKEDAKLLLRQYAEVATGLDDAMTLAKLDSLCRSFLKYENKRTQNRTRTAYFAIFSAYILALKQTGTWSHVRRVLSRDTNFKDSEIVDDVWQQIRFAASTMRSISKTAKKNEPAFYKNGEAVSMAVRRTISKLRPRIRAAFR